MANFQSTLDRRFFLSGGLAAGVTALSACGPGDAETRRAAPRPGHGYVNSSGPSYDDLFHVGAHNLHPTEHINFQLNRVVCLSKAPIEEVRMAARNIEDLEDFTAAFERLYKKAAGAGRWRDASVYARMSEFYMSSDQSEKREAIQAMIDAFGKAFSGPLQTGAVSYDGVVFEGTRMRTMRLKADPGAPAKQPIVLTLGFDAFIEEVYPVAEGFRRNGYDVVLFEGPGQGLTLHDGGLPMTYEWEGPASAVLDGYGLDNVTLIGLSLGGYLGLRASAFEKRIGRFVAFNVMPDFFEVLTRGAGQDAQATLKILLNLRLSSVFNGIIRNKMEEESFARWGVEHGMFVFGRNTPYKYFKEARDYGTEEISRLVSQDVLLTAGEADHYVPNAMLAQQAERLTEARSLETVMFKTEDEAGAHCQIGNLPLAIDTMADWIGRVA